MGAEAGRRLIVTPERENGGLIYDDGSGPPRHNLKTLLVHLTYELYIRKTVIENTRYNVGRITWRTLRARLLIYLLIEFHFLSRNISCHLCLTQRKLDSFYSSY